MNSGSPAAAASILRERLQDVAESLQSAFQTLYRYPNPDAAEILAERLEAERLQLHLLAEALIREMIDATRH